MVAGFLVKPAGDGPFPCLIYNRGGNREFGALTHRFVEACLAPLAEAGYLVAASQYRVEDEFGGADLNDVLNLIPFLEALPCADANRIGMYGWSRGGLMTYLALARTNRIRAAIVEAGSADQFLEMEERPEFEALFAELIPDYAANRQRELEARSPVLWAERLCKQTPILLLHSRTDQAVPARSALRMAEALCVCAHPFQMMIFEDGGHGLAEHRAEADRLILEWLFRHLAPVRPFQTLV